ncbi:MAG: alpha-L-fucosidase [Kiritimatiellae bacterium]|nr:alpha-L-fucosidase [Kiritimatiellia bacterium]
MAHEVNGKTEFFRGCPAEWKDVSFENIALSDGRRVSGRRVDGKVRDLVFIPSRPGSHRLGPQKAASAAQEAVQEGHGYTPKGYVQPKEPEVRERLEWFKDQKLALMMHWGLCSTIGIKESWCLVDKAAKRARREVTWTGDADEFKRQYYGLARSFNPVRFEPEKWAKTAKDCGFKYVLFTTKHHDGFCLYDSKYTDFKVTSPECPFSTDRRADIVRHVFNAFRAEGLGIAAYFSKSDWHNEDFWEDHGIGRYTTAFPTYDVKKNPAKWAKFREFAKNQILEIVRGYGPIDIIWLDGGQVQRRAGLDIRIEEIIAEARKTNPALISVDRTAGGPCENVITPEQTVPKQPIAVPWESCVTIGKWWGYHFDDEYKSVREIVHMLVDVVAKGGNLALNVGPQPDGRLPHQALERMAALGAWLKANGEAIYETRPLAPYRTGGWAFTRNRKTGREFAIRLWNDGEKRGGRQVVPVRNPSEVKSVTHLASGRAVPFERTEGGLALDLPDDLPLDDNADVFALGKKAEF